MTDGTWKPASEASPKKDFVEPSHLELQWRIAEGYRDMLEQLEPGSPTARHLNEMLHGEQSMFVRLIAQFKKHFENAKAESKDAGNS